MDALKGQKRDKAIVMPRQIAMYLMREETDVSLLRIGAELGGRDHSTVLHACDKIAREIAGERGAAPRDRRGPRADLRRLTARARRPAGPPWPAARHPRRRRPWTAAARTPWTCARRAVDEPAPRCDAREDARRAVHRPSTGRRPRPALRRPRPRRARPRPGAARHERDRPRVPHHYYGDDGVRR